MLSLIAPNLLARLGLDFETCRFTLAVTRTGNTVEVTTIPAVDPRVTAQIAESIPPEALREGVAYQAVADNAGVPHAVTADGQPVDETGDEAAAAANLRSIAEAFAEAVTFVRDFLAGIDRFEDIVTGMSAATLGHAAYHRREEILASNDNRLVLRCSGCGTDRHGRQITPGVVAMTSELTCGFPLFGTFAEILEETGSAVVARVRDAQLRRLKLELEAAGSDLVVSLPEGDHGDPWDGAVFSAYQPPPPRPARSRLEELLGLLDVVTVIDLGVLGDPEDKDRFERFPEA